MGADAVLAPPLANFRLIRSPSAGFEVAANVAGKLHHAGDIVGRGMVVGELGPAGGLRHCPLGGRLTGIPASVVDHVAEHVGHPAGGGSVDSMDAAQSARGGDLLDLAIVDAVTVLMADHGLDARLLDHVTEHERFIAGQGNGLLKSDQFRTGVDAGLEQGSAKVGQSAEAEDIGLEFSGKSGGVGAGARVAQRRGGGVESGLDNVADSHDLETGIGVEGCGVMLAALAHAYDDDTVLLAHVALLPWYGCQNPQV